VSEKLFTVAQGGSTRYLISIDTSDASTTDIAECNNQIIAMARHPTTNAVYVFRYNSTSRRIELRTINLSTGALGSSLGDNINHDRRSLGIDNDGTGYTLDYTGDKAYEIDLSDFTMTELGGTGKVSQDPDAAGLSWHDADSKMYAVQDQSGSGGQRLYTLNRTNGALTNVGSINNSDDLITAIAINKAGACYGISEANKLWTINLSTGAATEVGTLSNSRGNVEGLVFATV